MIERGRRPGGCVVADRAILRKTRGNMVWIRCATKLRLMTGHAGCRQTGILPIQMACRALLPGVRTAEWEWSTAMIECRPLPGVHGMT